MAGSGNAGRTRGGAAASGRRRSEAAASAARTDSLSDADYAERPTAAAADLKLG